MSPEMQTLIPPESMHPGVLGFRVFCARAAPPPLHPRRPHPRRHPPPQPPRPQAPSLPTPHPPAPPPPRRRRRHRRRPRRSLPSTWCVEIRLALAAVPVPRCGQPAKVPGRHTVSSCPPPSIMLTFCSMLCVALRPQTACLDKTFEGSLFVSKCCWWQARNTWCVLFACPHGAADRNTQCLPCPLHDGCNVAVPVAQVANVGALAALAAASLALLA